jgi:hypothetical protein
MARPFDEPGALEHADLVAQRRDLALQALARLHPLLAE